MNRHERAAKIATATGVPVEVKANGHYLVNGARHCTTLKAAERAAREEATERGPPIGASRMHVARTEQVNPRTGNILVRYRGPFATRDAASSWALHNHPGAWRIVILEGAS